MRGASRVGMTLAVVASMFPPEPDEALILTNYPQPEPTPPLRMRDPTTHPQRNLQPRTSQLTDKKWLKRKARRKMALESRRRNRT
jgi:hypothetical protein